MGNYDKYNQYNEIDLEKDETDKKKYLKLINFPAGILIFYLCWNVVMPNVFGLKKITFLESACFIIMINVVGNFFTMKEL